MKLKKYNLFIILFIVLTRISSQDSISFNVKSSFDDDYIPYVEVYDSTKGYITTSDANGEVTIAISDSPKIITLFAFEYSILEVVFSDIRNNSSIYLNPLTQNLSEVEVISRKAKIFSLTRLKDFEGTSIYAGKKNEVILVEENLGNLASNNARQIYSQVPGLNIYQNDDAGLQLNIGGRGLDPNRSSNFNTRQNGYDISADVLGYPESYYTPPAEALRQIQVIRGAASLQYGTQFGGLVNFILKEPPFNNGLNFEFRNTIGSNNLYTNFTRLAFRADKLSFNTFYNYKNGDGFRSNSEFKSDNIFANLVYHIDEKTQIGFELTHFEYLCQQAGGLNDNMFYENPFQSNRTRNWFSVDWLLFNLKFKKELSLNKNISINFFGLKATRSALGFRVNRVDQIDSFGERDLIVGNFNNFGFETKFLSNYKFLRKESIFLLGLKYYNSHNESRQGPGSELSDADFNFYNDQFPFYFNQSNYKYPNKNIAFFGENILKFAENILVTPGFRVEYINTNSNGSYRRIIRDAGFNVIADDNIFENRSNERLFFLAGIGLSYKKLDDFEFYLNFSQNYRSVTFADISTVNPAYAIDPDIADETGFTFDVGSRGTINNFINYDTSLFFLNYNNRIGFIQKEFSDGNVKAFRTNTGKALIMGIEGTTDINLQSLFYNPSLFNFNVFINLAVINSKYINSNEPGVTGNKVEFVPDLNFKTGIKYGYKNFTTYLQYSYLSDQFTDSSNATLSNLSGVIGLIPSYDIIDFSISQKFKKFKLEMGINNVLNNYYFTRRATGYPGPGIIPSPPRNFYLTTQFKF
jgi:Fe(3+) dicitrate transport protein